LRLNWAMVGGWLRTKGVAVRIVVAAVALWVALGSVSLSVLRAMLPAQGSVYGVLMPEHRVEDFALQSMGAQLSLVVRSRTIQYLVVRGKAYPPGIDFEASTPARSGLLPALVVVLGGLLLVHGRAVSVAWRAALGLGLAVLLAVAIPAVVLAGAQWGTVYSAWEEMSLPAMLVAASNFLLHGGGLALGAATVWVLRVGSAPASTVPRPSRSWPMTGPANS